MPKKVPLKFDIEDLKNLYIKIIKRYSHTKDINYKALKEAKAGGLPPDLMPLIDSEREFVFALQSMHNLLINSEVESGEEDDFKPKFRI